MSQRKLGGSGRYEDLGPGAPHSPLNYTVGGRSVHSADAGSGLSKNTVRDMRPKTQQTGAFKPQPFVIKRRSTVLPDSER